MISFKKRAEMKILLLGTMSSGKTALVNALLGGDYLPSANEATTNKIFWINSSNHKKDLVYKDGENDDWNKLCSLSLVKINGIDSNNTIYISGRFDFLSGINHHIDVIDVPGYNYSGNVVHTKILDDVIQNHLFTDLFVILDYTQLFTKDQSIIFSSYINRIVKKNSDIKILFILNKIDNEDRCKGDSIDNSISKLIKLIESNIKNINYSILPISSLIAAICKKELNGSNSKKRICSKCVCHRITKRENHILYSDINSGSEENYYERISGLAHVGDYIRDIYIKNQDIKPSFMTRITDNVCSLFDKGKKKRVKAALSGSGIGSVEGYLKSRCVHSSRKNPKI